MKSTRTALRRASNCPTGGAQRRSRAIRLALALALAPALHAQRPPVFSSLLGGLGQEYAAAVTSDLQGNTYAAGLTYSSDFPVTAGAYQTKFGGTCDAFVVKLGPDGKIVWATYLGGILDDWATSIALDSAGNVLVGGQTRSANFPLANPIQATLDNGSGDDYDAFIAKLDPTGGKLLYSTFLGGQADDSVAALTVDAAGNAYAAVNTISAAGFPGLQNTANQYGIIVTKLTPQGTVAYSVFHPNGTAGGITLDNAGAIYVAGSFPSVYASSATKSFGPSGTAYAFVFKLLPDGSKKIYETAIGGSVSAVASAIAVNTVGEAYIAGRTSSADFPLVHPLQTSLGARPLWKSTDSGSTWVPSDDLPFALPQSFVPDPLTPTTVYAATGDLGVFKTVDAGATWIRANTGITGTNISALAIDPAHPQTLYAAASSAVYKSTDGANSWAAIDSPPFPISQLAVDGQSPSAVYEVGANIRKSTDGGATWNAVTFPGTVAAFALDPRAAGHLFAISNMVFCGFFCNNNQPSFLYRSVDGGATWIKISNASLSQPGLVIDASTNPSTIYTGLYARSVDGGVTWAPITGLPFGAADADVFAIDPAGNYYVAAYLSGMYLSRDHGQTWTAIGNPTSLPSGSAFTPAVNQIVPAGSSGMVYATLFQTATSGFISKLSADGATLEFSTYLRAHASTGQIITYAAEPNVFLDQSWISAIALDSAGNLVVAGGTRGNDLPTAGAAAQPASAGLADAFLAIVAADGSKLNHSTYFGASQDDAALAAALDSQGNAIIAGQTWSHDFPVTLPFQPDFGYGDAFVTKLATTPGVPVAGAPVISAVLNGASFRPGIEAGSWVAIKGANLANTNPGRTWTSAEIVNGALPTSLDGVSVTIDGKPAFVEYVSPTQINVQAPADATLGAVNVVVNNNGAVSAPATAQLQASAPAFFLYGSTSFAAANLLPDYAPVADPAAVPNAVAAHAGDTLVLWGTGFGATNPVAAPGAIVTGAPAVAAPMTVTVGGMPVPIVSAVLAPGEAGLYQVTIQLPANVPIGVVAVAATVGGVPTPSGVTLFVVR